MERAEVVSRRVKLRQLEVLLAVARSGSMAKAATRLAITQPVVSKSIADLEETLGVRLLDRTPRGVEPTLYGRALLQRSVGIFNDLRLSVTELEFLSEAAAGELRIGASDAVASGMLGVIMDRLRRQYPRINLEVPLVNADLPYRDLRDRAIDLVIGRLPGKVPDDMDAIVLYEDELYIVGGVQNPLTRRRNVKLAELINEPWCGPSFDEFPWSLTADLFRARGLPPPRCAIKTRSILARTGLLATGPYLTTLPRTLLRFAGGVSLRRVHADTPVPTFPVGIITLRNRTPNPATHHFIACAREVSKPFRQRA